MLLAVDIGNTNIKFGVFDGDVLVSRSAVPTEIASSAESLRSALGSSLDVPTEQAVVCSVVPEADAPVKQLLRSIIDSEPLFVTNDLDLGLRLNYEPLDSLGTDRLVNCVAAAERYGVPVIVCSFGTATTFDAVNSDRILLGGAIAPGMRSMAASLHSATSKLPNIDVREPHGVFGNSTADSISSGVFYGHIALAEGMIERMKGEMGQDPKVVGTGGSAALVAEHTRVLDVVDQDLLLRGLRYVCERLSPG